MLSRRFISAVVLSAPLFVVYCSAQVSPSNQFITVKTNSTIGTPVAVADFNRDGKPDVLVSGNFSTGTTTVTLALLLNDGSGNFTTVPVANAPAIGIPPIGPFYAVADVNGDDIPDIVVSAPSYTCDSTGDCEYDGGAIYVLIGEGNGTFDSPQIYNSSQGIFAPSYFAVADVNGDGYPDLVVLTSTQVPAIAPNGKVQVLLNDGHGKFTKGSSFTSPLTRIYGAGDFTNDGRNDIVGTTALTSNYTQTLQILKNLGNGSLQVAAQDPEPAIAGVGIADLNQDGRADLVLAENNRVFVLLGSGNYTFSTTSQDGTSDFFLPLASGVSAKSVPVPTPVVVGDFNRDGHLDFITGQQVFFGNGDGEFTNSKIYSPGYSILINNPQSPNPGYTGALFTADFNGGGNLDLIGSSDYNIVLWPGNHNGIFNAPYQALTLPGIEDMVAADVNHDGIPDLLVFTAQSNNSGGTYKMSIYPGTGNGYFNPPLTTPISPGGIMVGDINNDHYQDLVIVTNNSIIVYPGGSDFSFGYLPFNNLPFDTGSFKYLEDVNNDGNLDLVGAVGVLLGNGDSNFQTTLHPLPISGISGSITTMAFGDFNGDGKLDIAALITEEYSNIPVTLDLLLGNGDGTFSLLSSTPASSLGLSSFGGGIAFEDLNHDGHLDLIYTGTGTDSQGFSEGQLLVQLGNGKGSFATPIRQSVLSHTANIGGIDRSLLLADFDRDGNLDAAVPMTGGFIQYFRGLGNGNFAAPTPYLIDSENFNYSYYDNYLTYYAITDINGDGYPDILKSLVTGDENSSPTEDAVTRLLNSTAHTAPVK